MESPFSFDILVIGGGPAGLTAAIAAAEHGASVCVAEPQVLGGHLNELSSVDLWDSKASMTGYDYGLALQQRAGQLGVTILPSEVVGVEHSGGRGHFRAAGGAVVSVDGIIVATGRGPGLSEDPRLTAWEGRGVIHCSSCDGPLIQGAPVVALVGGPAGLSEGLATRPFTRRLTLVVGEWQGQKPDTGTSAIADMVVEGRLTRVLGRQKVEAVELSTGEVVEAAFVVAKDEGRPERPGFLDGVEVAIVAAWVGHVRADLIGQNLQFVLADAVKSAGLLVASLSKR